MSKYQRICKLLGEPTIFSNWSWKRSKVIMYVPSKCPNLKSASQADCNKPTSERKPVKLTSNVRRKINGRTIRPSWFFFGQIALLAIPICTLFAGFYLSNMSVMFVLMGGGFMVLAVFCAIYLIALCYRTDKCDDYLPLTRSNKSSRSRRCVTFSQSTSQMKAGKCEKLRNPEKDSVYCELHAPSTNLGSSYSFPKINPSDCESIVKFPVTSVPSQNTKINCRDLLDTVNESLTLSPNTLSISRCVGSPDNLKANLEILCSDQMKNPIDLMTTIEAGPSNIVATSGDDSTKTEAYNMESLQCPIFVTLHPTSSKDFMYQWRKPLTTDFDHEYFDLLDSVSRMHESVSNDVGQYFDRVEGVRKSLIYTPNVSNFEEVINSKEFNESNFERADRDVKFDDSERRTNDYFRKLTEYNGINEELFLDFILSRSLQGGCRVSCTDSSSNVVLDKDEANDVNISLPPVKHTYDAVNRDANRKQRKLQALFLVSLNDSMTSANVKSFEDITKYNSSDSSTCSPPQTKKCRRFENAHTLDTSKTEDKLRDDSKVDSNFDKSQSNSFQDNGGLTSESHPQENSNAGLPQTEAENLSSSKNRKIYEKVESTFFKKSSSICENVLIKKVFKQKKKTLKQFK